MKEKTKTNHYKTTGEENSPDFQIYPQGVHSAFSPPPQCLLRSSLLTQGGSLNQQASVQLSCTKYTGLTALEIKP